LLALGLALLADRLFPLPLPDGRGGSTVVLARDGTPLRAFADADGIWRYPTAPERVSPLYLDALLGYEDRWFWRHPGVNPLALGRAAAQMLWYRRPVSGGSTLTMQVARILDPHSRTLWGKAKQVFRALQLEAHCSKREILTLYLDRAPFGGTIEGVEAASWAYLGKPAQRLSHAEAALLAVLPQSPSRLRPDREPAAAQRARDKVLDRLATLGVWDATTVADARIEQVATRACAARSRSRRASPAASTANCRTPWKRASPPTSRACPSAPRPRCWWWTTPRWRRAPTLAPAPSATRRGWVTWTWCARRARPAPP